MSTAKNAFDPLDLEIIDCVFEAAWAQIEAREPFRDRDKDESRRSNLRKQVLAAAHLGSFDFDIPYDRVLEAMPEHWTNVMSLKPRTGGGGGIPL
jgi:hypothetical protein